MRTTLSKVIAGLALPAAIATLSLGIAGTSSALAANEAPEGATGNVGDTTTTAETTTLPWCGWYINGLSAEIALEGAATYSGQAVALQGDSGETVEAFINGGSTYSGAADNCSWYDDGNKQSASLTVALAQGSSTSFTAATSQLDNSDVSMNFELTEENPLAITATPNEDCDDNSFTVESDASIYAGQTSSTPVSSSTSRTDINTANKCSWTMTYATEIPANKSPKYGDLTYTYTGPTLVTTLEVADALAPTAP